MIGNIIAAIVIGIIAGYLGRALLPGDDSMGFVATVVVGIVGALVGYFLFTSLLGIGDTDKFDLGGIIGAIVGGSTVSPVTPLTCTVTTPTNAILAVLPAHAVLPPKGAPAEWDLQVTWSSGDVQTILNGPVEILGDVTLRVVA